MPRVAMLLPSFDLSRLVASCRTVNLRLVTFLVVSCLLFAIVTAIAVHVSVERLLKEDAVHTAEDWVKTFIGRLPRIHQIANGAALTLEEERIIVGTRDERAVFLFKIFDATGRLRLAADKTETFSTQETLSEHNAYAAQVLRKGEIFVDVKDGAGKANRPGHYAEAYVPVVKNGATVAVVEAYVDQTRRFEEYRLHAIQASTVLGVIACLAFGLPAMLFYRRSQQMQYATREIAFLAHHDPLTGLPNRSQFQAALEVAWRQAGPGNMAALLCLDLDRFKAVNDGLGHAAGDELLRQVANRLRQAVRRRDVIARLGGDEFAIIQTAIESPADSEALAERLVTMMADPFQLENHSVQIGTSVGVALIPGDATSSAALIKAADVALYKAKTDGRGAYRFFSPGMDEALQRRRELEAELRLAIGSEQFEVHYQPIQDLKTSATVCFEALLRWRHPQRGLISPAEFIPLAEETGLIVPIGQWVLQRACRDATSWPDGIRVAVNISAVQFRAHKVVADVAAALAQSGLEPSRLELEMTEGVIMDKSSDTLAALHELKAMGTRLAMDDFGTGYSSLSYLQQFPFDKIKIDKSFVDNLGTNQNALEIVRAVINLGATLGKSTTAEGVESIEQKQMLHMHGCTEVQGYLIGRPAAMPAPAFRLDPEGDISVAA